MFILSVTGALPFFVGPYLIHDWVGVVCYRACISVLSASFVMCQAWTTSLYDREVVGQATALAAGWGNLGGAMTQIVMVDIHQLLDQELQGGRERGEAWRLTLMFPGILLLVMAGVVWKWGGGRGGGGRVGGRVGRRSDEAGGRKKKEMGGNNLLGREGGKEGGREGGKKEGDGLDRMPNRQEGGEGKKEERKEGRRTEDAWAAWMEAGREGGTWILALQYALSFGVEL
ncbi:hypothetical protein VYU27_007664, partial [Nannochloropsis oceanica]